VTAEPIDIVDLVFRGGVVLTGVPSAPRARAAAVSGGQVVAVDDVALDLAGAAREVVDLEGGALLPGFGDGHAHPLWGGLELEGPQVRDCTTVDEVVAAVRAFAADHPELEWIVGGPYDPAISRGGLFDASWLDQAVTDRPVALQSADHHCAWVNTEALRRAGIGPTTADPPSATIAHRPDGSPLGTLVEWNAMDLVLRHAPTPTDSDKRRAVRRSTALLAEAGITWVQEAALHPHDVGSYLDCADAGDLAVRVNIALRAEPGQWPGQRGAFATARAVAASRGAGMVSARTVKFFADGVVEAGTAAMLSPYDDAPASCGLPVWSPAELAEAVAAFDADGFQVHIHAIGDAGVRAALDAVEHAAGRNGPRDRRAVIAHTQVVHPDDLPRFAELAVVANFEPLWAQLDPLQTELSLPRIGATRGGWQYPMGTLLASGAVVSMGSDWPVSSHRPLEGLAVAVTRQTRQGSPPGGWVPEQRLPVAAALSAYTLGSAYQAFEDHLWGTVVPGKRADLVWLDADPYDLDPAAWPDARVQGTWLAGTRTAG